jgi:hypothetical protein
VSDADEILTRRAVRLLAECQVTNGHGPGRMEMEGYRYINRCINNYYVGPHNNGIGRVEMEGYRYIRIY